MTADEGMDSSATGGSGKPYWHNMRYPSQRDKQILLEAESWLRRAEAYCILILAEEGVIRVEVPTSCRKALERRLGLNTGEYKVAERVAEMLDATTGWNILRSRIIGEVPLTLNEYNPIWVYTVVCTSQPDKLLDLNNGFPFSLFRTDKILTALMLLLHLDDIRTLTETLGTSNRGKVYGYFTPVIPSRDSLKLFTAVSEDILGKYRLIELYHGIKPKNVTRKMLDDFSA